MGTVAARREGLISFAAGYPASDLFPLDELRAITVELLGGDGSALQYGPTRGYAPLVDALVEELGRRSITATPGEVLVTTGSQQGLDLAARVLVGPGEVVLVELPTFTGGIAAFRNVQANVVGVRQGPEGIDLQDLERVSEQLRRDGTRIKLLYVIPNFQNPTGRLLGRSARRTLLEWAERYDSLIVEDDPYGSLFFEGESAPGATRPIKADDGAGRVVYLSSFSKTLAPGFRVGWMAAPAELIERFEIAKQGVDLATGSLDQRVAYEALRRGLIERLAPRLRAAYRSRRDAMVDALRAHVGQRMTFDLPAGGFFLWATLPPGEVDDALLDRALEAGVIFVAGSAFFVDGSGHDTVRLTYSVAPLPLITEGAARLARALESRPVARR
jgi:2-aminoadipate transaminase